MRQIRIKRCLTTETPSRLWTLSYSTVSRLSVEDDAATASKLQQPEQGVPKSGTTKLSSVKRNRNTPSTKKRVDICRHLKLMIRSWWSSEIHGRRPRRLFNQLQDHTRSERNIDQCVCLFIAVSNHCEICQMFFYWCFMWGFWNKFLDLVKVKCYLIIIIYYFVSTCNTCDCAE